MGIFVDKVLVGGPGLRRLNADGQLDTNFHSGELNADSLVTDMALVVVPPFRSAAGTIRGPQFVALQSDGRVVVAGDFIQIGRTNRLGLARLYGGEVPFFPPAIVSGSLRYVPGRGSEFRVTGYPGLLIVQAATRLDPPDWAPIVTSTIGANATVILDTNALRFPQRFYRLVSP